MPDPMVMGSNSFKYDCMMFDAPCRLALSTYWIVVPLEKIRYTKISEVTDKQEILEISVISVNKFNFVKR
jgi:hypothetical protein